MEKSLEPELSECNLTNEKTVTNEEDVKLSEVQIRELRQIQIVNFIQRTIIYLALASVVCGSIVVGVSQFMKESGISFPLNKIHKYGYNSYFGGLIKLVKVDESIEFKEEKIQDIESPMHEEETQGFPFGIDIPGTIQQIVDFYENIIVQYKPNFYEMILGLFYDQQQIELAT